MAQGSLRPQKTAMLVAQRIVADINRRGNVVGDRLPPEKAMLDAYEVGRGTLRESLRYLELQGVLSLKPGPGGGPVVQEPDATSLATSLTLLLQFEHAPFRTLAQARAGLEPMVARLAAEHVNAEQLAGLKASVDTMREHLDDQNVFLAEDRRFHELVAHASGNAMFRYLIDALLWMLDSSAIGLDYPEVRRIAVHKAHLRIYQALAEHSPDTAAAAMAKHIDEYGRYAERRHPEALAAPIVWTTV
ncbi:GntR family transcriptional regulator [Acrocarpospora phusangensis]|uniref:GntR family transcriptional regulator n=1 Tax=Acrocarpospora phusangensis TaxID=1070424 RepID=A0A919Q4H1_9ACTN|nr:FCD domain-containing protein [Acrocarpospora phusangensis]GIH22184.1 GntR family transcriptional regulator [Acrocarpospora phusangensis]